MVWREGSHPSTETLFGLRPISSSASRNAVSIKLSSLSSLRPPGKLIWPGWWRKCNALVVKMTCKPSCLFTIGTSTAASFEWAFGVKIPSNRPSRSADWCKLKRLENSSKFNGSPYKLANVGSIFPTLSSVSWYSESHSESATRPPPAQQWICSLLQTKVRIVILVSISPFGRM